VAQLLLLLFIL